MIVTTTYPEKAGRLLGAHAERIHLVADLPPHREWTEEHARIGAAFDAPVEPIELPEVDTTNLSVPGPRGPIGVCLYTPQVLVEADEDGRRPAFVWIHGGAFISGDLDGPEADHTSRRIAHATGIPVISVDYRLCRDGVCHPAPHDDVWAAYLWVREGGHGIATDPARVVVGGASAGGCLAGTIGVHGRDAATSPAAVVLIYPTCHYPVPAPDAELSHLLDQLPPLFRSDSSDHDALNWNYLGGRADQPPGHVDNIGWALPGQADDLTGFPPTYIENCEFDELRASGEKFATQLREVGCDVEMHTVPGEIHGHLSVPGLPSATQTCANMATYLKAVTTR
ncbi:alpha/beta hydrolase [Nanchangia anserum]|uniref:Alpha/beta hydrolase n=1 Tax=Nanchangia anserum TaxID=2692125 RepID=A0A8I0GGS8_9ACTO|nr:alpha/beta hydrolase fold domain-containing protein [Nanchangia anserum]MBD3689734.1 alpha/beta hydrolase [Nanchangia anserum]QOX81906.1 alpha/beta hydrolase [Nanchangia anserum]